MADSATTITAATATTTRFMRMTLPSHGKKSSLRVQAPGMPSNEVVLVRHGETEWAKLGRHTGRTDIPLTEEGHAQAELAGRRLVGREFALVLTEPLLAAETCRLAGFGEQSETTDDLLESDYGTRGQAHLNIRVDRPRWTLLDDGLPGGETARQVRASATSLITHTSAAPGTSSLRPWASPRVPRRTVARP